MGFCQRILSMFVVKNYSDKLKKDYDIDDFPDEDYAVTNPYYNPVPTYAIKQKRRNLDGKGFHTVYVINTDGFGE